MFANPTPNGVYKRRRSSFEAESHQQEALFSSTEGIEEVRWVNSFINTRTNYFASSKLGVVAFYLYKTYNDMRLYGMAAWIQAKEFLTRIMYAQCSLRYCVN
jgi:hypothetical protein